LLSKSCSLEFASEIVDLIVICREEEGNDCFSGEHNNIAEIANGPEGTKHNGKILKNGKGK
jgi:hypothetical protein